MTIKIVTDTTCTMNKDLIKQLDIHMVPLSVMVDDVIFSVDETFNNAKFMDMMQKAKALPKSSQPPIGVFAELYDELGKDGSQIISIHMTEALSGTVNAARQAVQLTKSDVTVIDSTFTDQSLSFQVIRAAELALDGATKEEILKEVEYVRENSRLFVGLSTMDNLVKGGRIGRVTGMLSNLLNIKAVLELENNELDIQVKGRGVKIFYKWLEGIIGEMKQREIHKIGISHADGEEIAEHLKQILLTAFPDYDIPIYPTNPIISTHTGKGAFAVMFY